MDALDCLIIGGGPAGLTAAVYLARFRRRVRLIDARTSRAELIPTTHNCPGFPEGISGNDLLERFRAHARAYRVIPEFGVVASLETVDRGGFIAEMNERRLAAKTVLLATGVVDIEPQLPNLTDAIRRGLIRHCPVCDGFEVIGQRLAVIGFGTGGLGEARFLSAYSQDVTLMTLGQPVDLDTAAKESMAALGIRVIEQPISEVLLESGRLAELRTVDGQTRRFGAVYSALGVLVRSELARQLGAQGDAAGRILTDDHQETSVSGLYAAGDVVPGLNQICAAAGQGAVAATAIHNGL